MVLVLAVLGQLHKHLPHWQKAKMQQMKQQQNTGFQTYVLNCFIVIYLKVKKNWPQGLKNEYQNKPTEIRKKH